MSLREELVSEISAALDTDLADAVKPFTGKRIEQDGVYNPVTEQMEEREIIYTGRGIFSRYKDNVVDGINIKANDQRLFVLQDEVSEPIKIDDAINGMQVLNVGQDPVSASWTVQLRVM